MRTSRRVFIAITLCLGLAAASPLAYATFAITNVQVVNITGTEAQVTWTTDIPAGSQVNYGLSTGNLTGYSATQCGSDTGTSTLTHCVSLSGLSPSTTYFYKVVSCTTGQGCAELYGGPFTSAAGGTSGGGSGGGTIPPSPSGFMVSGSPTTNSISFSWNTSSGADKYNLYRKLSGENNWPTSYITQITGSTSYTDTTVSPSTTYDYRLEACLSSYGCSSPASLSNITTPPQADTIAPSVPTGLSVGAISSTEINLSWSPSTDNIGVTSYKIFRNSTFLQSVTGTNYTDSALSPNTAYTYFVKAGDAAGNESGPSSLVYGTTASTSGTTSGSGSGGGSGSADTQAPSQPTNLVATRDEYNRVDLYWGASTDNVGVAGYIVNRNRGGAWTELAVTTQNSFTDNTVTPATSYYYSVSAYDSAGNKSPTSTMLFLNTPAAPSATTTTNTTSATAPSAPTNLVATASGGTVYLNWTDTSSNETGFKIYRYFSGMWTDIGNTDANVSTYTNTGLSSGTYGYKVQAFNVGANGGAPLYSAPSSVATITVGGTSSGATTSPITAPATASSTTTLAPITASSSAANSVVVSVIRGASYCEGGLGKTPLTFSATPYGRAFLRLNMLSPNAMTTIVTPGTQILKNGAYRWEAFPYTDFVLSGKTSDEFVLDHYCAPVTSVATTTSAPTTIKTTTSLPPPPPPVTPPPPSPTVASLPSDVQPSTPVLATTVETINTQEQYARYCDDPKHQNECKAYATEKSVPVEIVPVVVDTTKVDLGVAAEKGIELPGGVTEAENLDSICAQSQYARSCADFLVTTGALSRVEADERARKLLLAREEIERTLEARDGSRMFLDTDQDGITDYDELNIYRTDPKRKDADGDGVFDGQELLEGTNPLVAPPAPLSTPATSSSTTLLPPAEQTKIVYEDPRIAGDIKPQFFPTTTLAAEPAPADPTTGAAKTKIKFGGKALPNSFVTLYIFSEPIVITVKTDESGAWTYTLDKELPDGKHEVYSTITDTGGRILAKSEPLPFVKEAAAVSLGSAVLLPPTNEAPGFFSGSAVYGLAVFLFGVIGLAISVIGFVAKQRDNTGVPPTA